MTTKNNQELKNSLQKKANGNVVKKDAASGMRSLLNKMSKEIERALPSMVSSERFQRVALTAFNGNKELQQCEPISFIAAMMQSAQLGLEPNTPLGQSYLIPYGKQVQFQIGYKGLLELAQRSGKIKTIYAHEVYENDEFSVEYGIDQKLNHKPELFGDRGEVIGYYAVYHLDNGGYSFTFMSKPDVLRFAKTKSKTFNNGPWQTDFDEMAKKTVIKKLLKYAPISIELQNAVTADESVKEGISEDMSEVADVSFEYEDDVIDVEAEEIDEDNEKNNAEDQTQGDKDKLLGQESFI